MKNAIYFILSLLSQVTMYSAFGQSWTLQYKAYDTLRNNKVMHEYHPKFQTGDLRMDDCLWSIKVDQVDSAVNNARLKHYNVTIILREGQSSPASWGVQVNQKNWDRENYLLMPGAVYMGNRFESRNIRYYPSLSNPRDISPEGSPIISDIPRLNIEEGPSKIQLTSGSMSVPCLAFTNADRTKAFWLLSQQQEKSHGDYLYTIEESGDKTQSWISLSAPAVREEVRYELCRLDLPSNDTPKTFLPGDSIILDFWWVEEDINDLQDFFKSYQGWKNLAVKGGDNAPIIPFSASFKIHQDKFNRENWIESPGYYAVGTPQIDPFQDWIIGWTGGMITTYPLLMKGDELTRKRALRQLDWLFPDGFAPSGVFWSMGQNGTEWHGGYKEHPGLSSWHPDMFNWHLARKGGDGLYYVLKQFLLMKKMGLPVPEEWESQMQKTTDAYASVWKNDGQIGQYIHTENLEVVIGGSSSGGIFPAAFIMAARYFDEPKYTELAEEMANQFYNDFTQNGLTTGGPADALQAPDSESAFALTMSYMLLYEETGESNFLEMAEDAAHQFLTWVVGYNYHFPPESTYGIRAMPSLGAVYANAQNTTAPVGICNYSGLELFKLYRATSNETYIKSLIDIVRVMGHHLSFGDRIMPDMHEGWMTERVNMNDGLGAIGEHLPYSCWAETAHMLSMTELPGIYVDMEFEKVFVFDHVTAKIRKENGKRILEVNNPTAYTAEVTLVMENASEKTKKWEDFGWLQNKKIIVRSGQTKEIVL